MDDARYEIEYTINDDPNEYYLTVMIKIYDGSNGYDEESYDYYPYQDPLSSMNECVALFKSALIENAITISIDEEVEMETKLLAQFHSAKRGNKVAIRETITQDDYISSISNNECAFASYAIELCFEKVTKGVRMLVPGIDKVPRNLSFINLQTNKIYYARIEEIEVAKSAKHIKSLDESLSKLIVGFKSPQTEYCVFFALEFFKESLQDKNIRYYKFENSQITTNGLQTFITYDLDKYENAICSSSSLTNNLQPFLSYYLDLQWNLNKNFKQVKLEVDIDLLRENYDLFDKLVLDEDSLVLPIKGTPQSIKSITLNIKDIDDNDTKFDFYEASVSILAKDDYEVYMQSIMSEIEYNKEFSLVLLDLVELSEKSKFNFKKFLINENVNKCIILNNIEGERTRIKRIITGIERVLMGEVENPTLVEIICKNDISNRIDSLLEYREYKKDVKYIKELKSNYPKLKNNDEQLMAIDKIMQMRKNEVDIMLVQGPPGTGKTELILSLVKELAKNNLKTLVTSNVHVACDNVTDRLKDNKDIILKRYTTIKGDQYSKEIIENQKRYVENQVLAGFQFAKDTISSEEVFNKLIHLKEETQKTLIKLTDEKTKYDNELNEYRKLLSVKDECESEIKKIEEAIHNEKEAILTLQEDVKKIDKVLITEEVELEKQNKVYTEINEQYEKVNSIKENIESKIEDLTTGIIENKEAIVKANENILSLEKQSKEIKEEMLGYQRFYKFLSSVSIGELQNEIINYVLYDTPFSSSYYNRLLEDSMKSLINIKGLYLTLKNDSEFWQGSSNFSISTLEYIYYSNFESNTINSFFEEGVLDSVSDIYNYYKLSNPVKTIMKYLGFIKVNNHNNKYYLEIINKLNSNLKRIQFQFKDYVLSIINEEINEEKFNDIVSEQKEIISNYNNELSTNTFKIEEENHNIIKFNDNIKDIEKSISVETKELDNQLKEVAKNLDCKTQIEDLIKQIQAKMDANEKNKNELLLAIETKNNHLIELGNSLNEKNILFNKYQDEVNKIQEEKGSLLEDYEKKGELYIIKIKEANKKLDDYTLISDKFKSKLDYLTSNNWSREEAMTLLANYIQELSKIVECEDEKKINHFLKGNGTLFNDMFLVSENQNGSIISMTTSQVASLINNSGKSLVFDYAIVDEASKCRFEDIIVSLPRVKHLVLIGDFMQLDQMYDAYDKIDARYKKMMNLQAWDNMNRSSFSVLFSQFVKYNADNQICDFDSNPSVSVMKRQYRMNKNIFKLIEPIYSIHSGFELIDEKQNTFNDLKCIDVLGEEIQSGTSQYNNAEIDAVVTILNEFKENYKDYPNIKSIGIITGYKAQQNRISRSLKSLKIPGVSIQSGTIDRFQGKEYDLVIISLVRTKKLGFINNIRRMNVAISRAKNHLIIFGNFSKLLEISRRKGYLNDEEYTNEDIKESAFVSKTLIPNLYRLKEEYVSNKEIANAVLDFLKENDYEE